MTDVQAPIYDIKTATSPFYTFHNILRCFSLVQSFHKGLIAPLWRKRESTHMRLPGTDVLRCLIKHSEFRQKVFETADEVGNCSYKKFSKSITWRGMVADDSEDEED